VTGTETALLMPVAGMTCDDCERHVVAALERAGATAAEADFRRGEARFRAPATVDRPALQRAVRAAGYEPGPVEAAEPTAIPRRRRTGRHGYDLAVVGSGGGAFAAAIKATELGARVVMVERGTVGGTCVNVGCVPSKTLLRGSELYHHAGHHPFAGLATSAGTVDLAALVGQKNELAACLRQRKYLDLAEEYGWELVRGEARFDDASTLRVGEATIRAGKVLLATGARPAVPPIPGLDAVPYLTSTSALELTRVPEHLVVVGAGYVALELGALFRRLGSRVTLMQRGERLLAVYDPEVAGAARAAFEADGLAFLPGVRDERVEKTAAGVAVRVTVGGEARAVEGDALLVAAGRTPNTEALALERAGVKTGTRGEVVVDDHLRTSNPDVYAAGDVTLAPQFVYVAAYQGALAAENALGGSRAADLRAVPAVMFTNPAIATVGLTEAQARAAGHTVKTSVLPASEVPRAIVNRDERGIFKLVADADTDRLLGVHVVAENAGDVIHAGVLAVKFGLTVRDLAETLAPYLTMAEGLKLAAQSFGRDVSKLSCCAA
jgi:mercuric reductase